MKTAVVVLTPGGQAVGDRLKFLPATVFMPARYHRADGSAVPYDESPAELVGRLFAEYDALVAVMAVGIVTRLIAPHLRSKHVDPAVVAVDEAGRYAVALVGGHERGANDLAKHVASRLGAQAVVTTASESRKDVVAGIGYRRQATGDQLESAIRAAVAEAGVDVDELRLLGTADIKMDDPALVEAAARLSVPVAYVSREALGMYPGEYERSPLVKLAIGVDGVCEPAALLLAKEPRLLLKKTVFGGVAVAIVREGSGA